MIEDILLPFSFPAVGRKKITAAFDGGRITSDSGVMLLGQAERRLGVADKLAAVIADPRNPLLITHSLGSIFRARILAIACGYEDADDLDHLRGFAGLDNVPNRTLPTLINARRPRDHRIVQFSPLVHFQTFRSQKFGQEFPHNVRRPLIVAARGEYMA